MTLFCITFGLLWSLDCESQHMPSIFLVRFGAPKNPELCPILSSYGGLVSAQYNAFYQLGCKNNAK